ncbi:HepT-like ribonuclease domain-containing protein [Thiobaca trueperi]|nr:HepT-like ribonuclease domain-containing protein [Thiobaca trueperi]
MIEAAEDVCRFINGRQRSELDRDRMLLFALVRAIEIIGEAASKVSDDTRQICSDIPWKAMVGMRNRLIHAYFDIDADILWVAATQEIPALLVTLKAHTKAS